MTMAMPQSAGTWVRNFSSASRPPAEQPIPTTGNLRLLELSAAVVALGCVTAALPTGFLDAFIGRQKRGWACRHTTRTSKEWPSPGLETGRVHGGLQRRRSAGTLPHGPARRTQL